MTLIIGHAGKARRGKDTAAGFAMDKYGDRYGILRTSFAAMLKREVNEAIVNIWFKECDGLQHPVPTVEQIQPAVRKLCDRNGVGYVEQLDMSDPLCIYGKQRHLLQWWGTEFRRAQDPDYWVRETMKYIDGLKPAVAIITDVRFPNELNAIKERQGLVVRFERKNFFYETGMNHVSEVALDGADFSHTITAETYEELKEKTLNFYSTALNENWIV